MIAGEHECRNVTATYSTLGLTCTTVCGTTFSDMQTIKEIYNIEGKSRKLIDNTDVGKRSSFLKYGVPHAKDKDRFFFVISILRYIFKTSFPVKITIV